jgi:hypothetical protein
MTLDPANQPSWVSATSNDRYPGVSPEAKPWRKRAFIGLSSVCGFAAKRLMRSAAQFGSAATRCSLCHLLPRAVFLSYPMGKSPETCPALRGKIFRFSSPANQLLLSCRPVPKEGTSAVVTNVGAGCGGRNSVVARLMRADERRWCVRRSRVVLTPRRWRQVCGRRCRPSRARHAAQARVARTPGRPGEREISRKTIAQGMPVATGEPVALPRAFFCPNHGCIEHPAFPAPSTFLRGDDFAKPRAHRVARMRCYVRDCSLHERSDIGGLALAPRISLRSWRLRRCRESAAFMFQRHCEERSDEAIQLFLCSTGLLRFARNDDRPTPAPAARGSGTAAPP